MLIADCLLIGCLLRLQEGRPLVYEHGDEDDPYFRADVEDLKLLRDEEAERYRIGKSQ